MNYLKCIKDILILQTICSDWIWSDNCICKAELSATFFAQLGNFSVSEKQIRQRQQCIWHYTQSTVRP